MFVLLELYDQTGRLAVITGGNRGIGLRILEKFLDCNMTVVMGESKIITFEWFLLMVSTEKFRHSYFWIKNSFLLCKISEFREMEQFNYCYLFISSKLINKIPPFV